MSELALKPDVPAKQAVQSIWFSSGTAALIASLEAVGAKGKWVALPPNVCPNVIAAIFGAGCKPWFVDIESERQGMDPQRLSEVISQVAAVIAVHAYGVPCKIDRITEIARHTGVPVIEDCAQADGAIFMGQEVGTFGDIAVFSFGTGKIVEAGGGGLAIVLNPRWQSPMEDLIAGWGQSSDTAAGEDLGNTYRFLYNRFYPGKTTLAKEPFFAVVRTLVPLFRTRCERERIGMLAEKRSQREALVLARRQKYCTYIEQLAGAEHIAPISLVEGAAPWRFNAVIDADVRDTVFRKLLASNISASTWYPRMTEFLPEHIFRSTDLPVAQRFERTLLNLWVDEMTDAQDIAQSTKKLRQYLLDPKIGY